MESYRRQAIFQQAILQSLKENGLSMVASGSLGFTGLVLGRLRTLAEGRELHEAISAQIQENFLHIGLNIDARFIGSYCADTFAPLALCFFWVFLTRSIKIIQTYETLNDLLYVDDTGKTRIYHEKFHELCRKHGSESEELLQNFAGEVLKKKDASLSYKDIKPYTDFLCQKEYNTLMAGFSALLPCIVHEMHQLLPDHLFPNNGNLDVKDFIAYTAGIGIFFLCRNKEFFAEIRDKNLVTELPRLLKARLNFWNPPKL